MTRIALIGCGALAELYYAPALRALQSKLPLVVKLLVDPNDQRLAVLAEKFPEAQPLGTVNEMVSGDVDLAIVASPQKFHFEQTMHLLEQRIHVLCEKPMASTVAEARAMVLAAERSACLLAVGLFRRFFPSSQFVKELLQYLPLGQPRSFEWWEGGPFNWPAASPSFFDKRASPGGVFADLGAHVVDLLCWWFGEPEEVKYEDDCAGGLEANACALFRFRNAVTGVVRLSRDTVISNSTRIEFDRGVVDFEGASAAKISLSLTGCRGTLRGHLHQTTLFPEDNPISVSSAQTYARSFVEQLRNVCEAMAGHQQLLVPATEGLRTVEVIEHCYGSRRPMRCGWLSPSEQAGLARYQSHEAALPLR